MDIACTKEVGILSRHGRRIICSIDDLICPVALILYDFGRDADGANVATDEASELGLFIVRGVFLRSKRCWPGHLR